jgi:hypothetical protein
MRVTQVRHDAGPLSVHGHQPVERPGRQRPARVPAEAAEGAEQRCVLGRQATPTADRAAGRMPGQPRLHCVVGAGGQVDHATPSPLAADHPQAAVSAVAAGPLQVADTQAPQLGRAQPGLAKDAEHRVVTDANAGPPVRHAQQPVILLRGDRLGRRGLVAFGTQPLGELLQTELAEQHPHGRHLHPHRRRRQPLAAAAAVPLPVVAPGQQLLQRQVLYIGSTAEALGQPGDQPVVDAGVVLAGLAAGSALGGHVGGEGQQQPTVTVSASGPGCGPLVRGHERTVDDGGRGHGAHGALQYTLGHPGRRSR